MCKITCSENDQKQWPECRMCILGRDGKNDDHCCLGGEIEDRFVSTGYFYMTVWHSMISFNFISQLLYFLRFHPVSSRGPQGQINPSVRWWELK